MAPAWSLVRGTSTRQPYSARDSHQESSSRRPTSAPMVSTSGPSRSAPALASCASVVSTVRCVVNVPFDGDRDGCLLGDAVARRARRRPRRGATRWRAARAHRAQRRAAPSRRPRARPPRRAPSRSAHPRTRAPPYRPARPARRRTATPAFATATASAMTESAVIGSPVTSRTAVRPSAASAIRSRATSSGSPTAGRTSAPSAASASSCSGTSTSWTTSGAPVRAARARTVNSPGSPGPVPTKATRPEGAVGAFMSWELPIQRSSLAARRRPCRAARRPVPHRASRRRPSLR